MNTADAKEPEESSYWLDQRHDDYHARQFLQPYRSTVALANFVSTSLPDATVSLEALDVGCGAGANMYHLGRLLTGARWTGVDTNSGLFELAAKLLGEHRVPAERYRFIRGDFYRLDELLPARAFDIVFSIQTLSWLPRYETALQQLAGVCKRGGALFVTSLFSDALVEARIEVTQYREGPTLAPLHQPTHYNVYCFERFRGDCFALGAREVRSHDFEIDVDLPVPAHRYMGTFTLKMADGRRLQQSGPLLMPWKFVFIRF